MKYLVYLFSAINLYAGIRFLLNALGILQTSKYGQGANVFFAVTLICTAPFDTSSHRLGQANYLEKICNEALSLIWSIYEKEADGLLSFVEVKKELNSSLPWIDEERHAQLRVLGEYYAKLKR